MIRTLVADDSAVVRAILTKILGNDRRFFLCDCVENGLRAVESARKHRPDLIIMDIDMPVMDGIHATEAILSEYKCAVIAWTTEDVENRNAVLDAGACDAIEKPNFATMDTRILKDFCDKIHFIATRFWDAVPKRHVVPHEIIVEADKSPCSTEDVPSGKFDALLIGASTGGPSAIQTVLSGLGPDFGFPVFVTQHIDDEFDRQLAQWLGTQTGMKVALAEDGQLVEKGRVYLAPSGVHLSFSKKVEDGRELVFIKLDDGEEIHFLKPSVDKMFSDAAKVYRSHAMAVLLTGMGRDGADGCREIVKNGGWTIAQDEKSCTIFGMPKAAIDDGSAKVILPLEKIAGYVKRVMKGI